MGVWQYWAETGIIGKERRCVLSQLTQIPCNRCSSNLIELSKVTERVAGFSTPVTTTKYKCSNQTCQDEADIRIADALAKRRAQEEAKQLRASQKLAEKAQ